MDVSVFTVNYKTPALVRQCIESVLSQQRVSFEMIVVDNHSQDESLAVLASFGPRIRHIANPDNRGFGRANNQAFRISLGRYLFMLNPDAACLSDLDLFHLVEYMDQHPEYGLIGTRITNSAGKPLMTAWDHYPRQKQTSRDFSSLPGKIATVLGASMFVSREALKVVGGFDENFFLYAEETDLCLRIREKGYQIGYFDGVTVSHVGGASQESNPRAEVIRMKKKAKYLFYQKHYPHKDVLAIIRKDLYHARFHLWRLALKKCLFGLNDDERAKQIRHQEARESALEYLRQS